MKLSVQNRSADQLLVGTAYIIILLIGFSIVRFFPQILRVIPPCGFNLVTGVSCPACGGTHTALYLSQLRIGQAFLSNPFVFILLIAMIFWGMNTLAGHVLKRNLLFELLPSEKKIVAKAILWAIPFNWLYLIIRDILAK